MKKQFLNGMMYVLAAVLWMPAYAATPAPKNIFSVSEDGRMVEISQTIITGLYQWEKAKEQAPSGWRLLTSDEWTYLLVTRDDANHYNIGMNNLGQIELTSGSGNYRHGLIILPDGWIQPEGTAFNCVHDGITFETNSYSYEQWEKMKAAGAVFLPADGYGMNGEDLLDEDKQKVRKSDPDSIHEPGVHGAYWASDGLPSDTASAYRMYYDGENGLHIHDMAYQKHYAYYSVLLVKDVDFKLLDELDETTAMTTRLNAARGKTSVIVHRTLGKDGTFYTLCLPFDVPDIADSPLAGAEVFTFDGGRVSGSTGYEKLNLELVPYTNPRLQMGVPYLLRWTNTGERMTMLRFDNVSNWAAAGVYESQSDPGKGDIKFHGLYPRKRIPGYQETVGTPHYNFFLGANNTLYWPDDTKYLNSKMKGFRAYFYLDGGGPNGHEFNNQSQSQVAARYRNIPAVWRIRNTATDLENVQKDHEPCTKVIKNGVLVIRHGGKEYNILGEIIK